METTGSPKPQTLNPKLRTRVQPDVGDALGWARGGSSKIPVQGLGGELRV